MIVRRSADGTVTDALPAPWNARTRVHEYGGGSWTVQDGTLWFTEFTDQRLYRLDAGGDTPVAVTPEPSLPSGVRHADLRVLPDALLAVRETHAEGDRRRRRGQRDRPGVAGRLARFWSPGPTSCPTRGWRRTA